MTFVETVTLRDRGVRLEPLDLSHETGLAAAAADGELWKIRVTSVPEPGEVRSYIETALLGRDQGHRFAFAVLDDASGKVLGTTSYHDIVPAIRRVEIGYTWYAKSVQRTHVNTSPSCCCWPMPSVRWAAMWWAGAQTTSTSPASAPSSGWEPRRMA